VAEIRVPGSNKAIIVKAESAPSFTPPGKRIFVIMPWHTTVLMSDTAHELIRALLDAIQEIEGRS